jgi:hypothetical protein
MPKAITNVLDRIEARQDEIDIGPNGMSVDLLQAVYRNPGQELHIRMRAAMACLPFETPKLLATAQISEGNFADLLDQRLARLAELRKLEANGNKVTEAQVIEAQPIEPEPAAKLEPAREPLARLYSPKFRPFIRRA